jgi:dsRNA-specific ribonuclease
VKCTIEQMNIKANGEGKSRRKAEQAAAEKAIIEVESRFGKKQNE